MVPAVDFKIRELGEWVSKTSYDIFGNKKVIVFALPGAFTPTCSTFQLPGYEEHYEAFKHVGIDEIYCLSVNDTFVMNAWADSLGIKNVKMLPDGSGEFTSGMGMDVAKDNLGFGIRSWRYAMIVENGVITEMFAEDDIADDHREDPYDVSSPEYVLSKFTDI